MATKGLEAGTRYLPFALIGSVLDDEVKWIKHSDAAWTKDGKGFFYSRFDEPKKEEQFQALNVASGSWTPASVPATLAV